LAGTDERFAAITSPSRRRRVLRELEIAIAERDDLDARVWSTPEDWAIAASHTRSRICAPWDSTWSDVRTITRWIAAPRASRPPVACWMPPASHAGAGEDLAPARSILRDAARARRR
jgi:hypothetical protein